MEIGYNDEKEITIKHIRYIYMLCAHDNIMNTLIADEVHRAILKRKLTTNISSKIIADEFNVSEWKVNAISSCFFRRIRWQLIKLCSELDTSSNLKISNKLLVKENHKLMRKAYPDLFNELNNIQQSISNM